MTETTRTDTSLAKRTLEVGERLRDGTVVLFVDADTNEALFVPARIFGEGAQFAYQDSVVESVNKEGLHGHKDWRRITDAEGEILSKAWDRVAPPEWQGRRPAPWFWLASPSSIIPSAGRMRRGGEAESGIISQNKPLLVPVVRSGPAYV